MFHKKIVPAMFSAGVFVIAAALAWMILRDEVDHHTKDIESCANISIQFFQSCSANSTDRFDACTAERRMVFDDCMQERDER